ncbi:MAG: hypothetical protein R3202_04875 [Candidatus Competibacterales bacterium]|nr:hypothetical protein [Candidatus Competibacterales bacterium]
MKKLSLAVAVTAALGASSANAAVVTEFSNGVLVPHVLYSDGSGSLPATSTAVGLTSCAGGDVYWTFFDANSKHIIDSQFPVTADDQTPFGWGSTIGADIGQTFDGNNFETFEVLGYLTFVLDTNSNAALDTSDQPCLAGAAFQLFPSDDEVAFIPAPPLQASNPTNLHDSQGNVIDTLDGDFGDAAANVYVPRLDALPDDTAIRALAAGANAVDVNYLRYFIDGATTDIVIWSAPSVDGRWTVNAYNDNQDRFSVTLDLPNDELNVISLPGDLSMPNGFVDGFIKWDLSSPQYLGRAGSEDGVLTFSIINAPALGATQTIVNPIRKRDNLGRDQQRVEALR